MEKAKARYVLYTPDLAAAIAQGYLPNLPLDPATEETVRAELSGWVVRNSCDYCYEYDDYDDRSRGYSTDYIPVSDMISTKTGCYSTSDILGEILVADGHFVGVVLRLVDESHSTWQSDRRVHYPILLTDGTVIGTPHKSYYFSGESSTKESDNDYSLIKKE